MKATFEELLRDQGDSGQRVRVRIDEESPVAVYAACSFPHRNLILEIEPIRQLWLPSGFSKPRINGLTVNLEKRSPGRDSDVSLLLQLQNSEALDVFAAFCARICESLNALTDSRMAVKEVIALLDRWKEFFSAHSEILSEGMQTGLYGELYLLKQLVQEGIPVGTLCGAWTGSKRTNQDLEFGATSIEVKSSTAVDATRVQITNARQLDDTGLDKLYLARMVFDARQGDAATLPMLVKEMRALLDSAAPEMSLNFEEKLIKAGYLEQHAEHYAGRSYSKRERTFYEVRDDFPRLIEGVLPDGVTKVSYELSLDSCGSFKTDSSLVIQAVRKDCD
ncbi:PD-(D/E)XK motif protein [Pseudomonadota bacterium]